MFSKLKNIFRKKSRYGISNVIITPYSGYLDKLSGRYIESLLIDDEVLFSDGRLISNVSYVNVHISLHKYL